jgi:aminopeptidase N
MRISPLAVALVAIAFPLLASAQDDSVQIQSVRADEQIILSQIMTDKRAVYARALGLTDEESRVFWPVYDEYEAKVKTIDDRLIRLIDEYAAKYSTMTDADAKQMLTEKMKLDRDRMDLQQAYTKKIARAVPVVKALRYAQVEWRIDNELQHKLMQLIPVAP